MFKRTFKVVFRPTKSNFLQLPDHYFNLVSTYDTGCLCVLFGAHVHHASWAPHAGAVKDTEIGINARVAKEIGLHENDLVKCSLIADVMLLKSVYVTPVSSKDWEIIELSSEKISGTILNQTRIINSTQNLIVWINKSMQVTLTVDRVKPRVGYGRINHNTELVIAPNLYKGLTSATDDDGGNETMNGNANKLSRCRTTAAMRTATSEEEQLPNQKDSNLLHSATVSNIKRLTISESLAKTRRADQVERLLKDLRRENTRWFEFRVVMGEWRREIKSQISDVYVTKSNLPEFMELNSIYCLRNAGGKEYYVKVKLVEGIGDLPQNIHRSIEINASLMGLLNIEELEKVVLKPKPLVMNFVEKLELFAHKKTHYKIIENAFKRFVIEKTSTEIVMLLNQGEVVRLEDDIIVSVGILPEHFPFCIIDAQFLKESKIYAADVVREVDGILNVKQKEKSPLSVKDIIKLPAFDAIVNQLVAELKIGLCLNSDNAVLRQCNVLLGGAPGTGKTVLVERVLDTLMRKPYYCFFDIFYCTRSKGRKPESIQKDLRSIFTASLQSAPSIVVLENLDVLARTSSEPITQDGEYYNHIADMVHQLIVQYTATHPVAVIATVHNPQSLNKRLYSARGQHLFQTVIKIPPLECADRHKILEELCSHINTKSLDLAKFASLTEGYKKSDLVQFVERAIFYAYRLNKEKPILTNESLYVSLENTNSYCLHGIESHQKYFDDNENDNLPVKDIPGLEAVVTVLEEVLLWPSLYPGIFNDSPLRNQSGVLLFGPPGTGKTFLVSQIASSWSLRMISVKGPELLAKYIGQSEENVRNLFSRARSAKPCVLFFDEFDSLAPKRGHDSTGVTDRVVNQLLTELDGVEGLQGVTVVAATSRPELLDPALLRSGRIDRLVECPLPDATARLRIFEVLSSSLLLDETVDLKWFAAQTTNYTGADIQGILTTANMTAVKEALMQCNNNEKPPDKIIVNQTHLMEAFQTTRPSLTEADIAKYQKTYARFTNKEKPPRDYVAKRATLA